MNAARAPSREFATRKCERGSGADTGLGVRPSSGTSQGETTTDLPSGDHTGSNRPAARSGRHGEQRLAHPVEPVDADRFVQVDPAGNAGGVGRPRDEPAPARERGNNVARRIADVDLAHRRRHPRRTDRRDAARRATTSVPPPQGTAAFGRSLRERRPRSGPAFLPSQSAT